MKQYRDSEDPVDHRFDISDVIVIVWADAPPRTARSMRRTLRNRRKARAAPRSQSW